MDDKLDKIKALAIGSAKSWTAWFAGILVIWPDIVQDVGDMLADIIGKDASTKTIRVIGLIVYLLRGKTTKSLLDKGANNA